MTKELRFPEAKSMADLFDRMEVVDRHNEDPIGKTPLARATNYTRGTVIGSFCGTIRLKRDTKWLRVKPNAETVEAVTDRTLTDYDQVDFALVERGDGTVLVTASANKIIQSIWLALLPDTSSLPADLFKEEAA